MADYDSKIIPILDDIIEDQATENDVVQQTDTVDPAALHIHAENNLELFVDEPEQLINDDNDPEIGAIVQIDGYRYDETRAVDFAADEFTALHSEISDETQVDIDSSGDDAEIDIETDAEDIESALMNYQTSVEEDNGTDFTADAYPATSGDIEPTSDAYSSDEQQRTFEPTTFVPPSVPGDTEVTSNEATAKATVETPAVATQNFETLPLEAVVDDIVKQLMPDLEQQLRFLVQQALEDRLSDAVLARLGIKDKQS
jgi:hypothetical protein